MVINSLWKFKHHLKLVKSLQNKVCSSIGLLLVIHRDNNEFFARQRESLLIDMQLQQVWLTSIVSKLQHKWFPVLKSLNELSKKGSMFQFNWLSLLDYLVRS